VLALALSNGGGEKRWARVLKWLDTVAGIGGGPQPSEQVRKLEEALGIHFGKDVAGKVGTVGLAVGDILTAPVQKTVVKGPNYQMTSVAPQVPVVFLVQTTDEEAARKLSDEVLPKVFSLMTGGKGKEPATRTVAGQTVHRVATGKHAGISYGRHGRTIVLGPYEGPVARALAAGAAKKGWLAGSDTAEALQKLHEPVFVGVAKPVGGLAMVFASLAVGRSGTAYQPRPTVKGVPSEKGFKPPPIPPEPAQPPQAPKVTVTVEKGGPAAWGKEQARMMKELRKVLAKEPPLVFGVMRMKDRIEEEAVVSGLGKFLPRLIDFGVEMSLRQYTAARRQMRRAVEEEERARRELERRREQKKER
jgi:hypothetical protein